jgi:glycine oxidase
VKTWDAIIVGAGVIGLSLAWELSKQGARVLVVERGEPGREATHAAAGMLAYGDPEPHQQLDALKLASARLYGEFVHQLEDESGIRVDFRRQGTVSFFAGSESPLCEFREITSDELKQLEPAVSFVAMSGDLPGRVVLTPEETVDNRALAAALLKTAEHRGIDVSSGIEATGIIKEDGRAAGVSTERTEFRAPVIIDCAGAWASKLVPQVSVVPRKGQALSVISRDRQLLSRAVRGHDVYLVPRSDGRIIIGATVEDAGYDKRVDPETIQRLHQAAANLVPEIGQLRMHEAWAGLRPATMDKLPIIGATSLAGLFVATAHFRNGILLAPITARVMAQVVRDAEPDCCIDAFSPLRFAASPTL